MPDPLNINPLNNLDARLTKLEVINSEQDYFIQTLNDVISRQDRQIMKLESDLKTLKEQIQSVKNSEHSDAMAIEEIPPHY
ncbi:MAG: SlyX protein [Gammaproteobacteria bacterium]|jgi:SlyX protein